MSKVVVPDVKIPAHVYIMLDESGEVRAVSLSRQEARIVKRKNSLKEIIQYSVNKQIR